MIVHSAAWKTWSSMQHCGRSNSIPSRNVAKALAIPGVQQTAIGTASAGEVNMAVANLSGEVGFTSAGSIRGKAGDRKQRKDQAAQHLSRGAGAPVLGTSGSVHNYLGMALAGGGRTSSTIGGGIAGTGISAGGSTTHSAGFGRGGRRAGDQAERMGRSGPGDFFRDVSTADFLAMAGYGTTSQSGAFQERSEEVVFDAGLRTKDRWHASGTGSYVVVQHFFIWVLVLVVVSILLSSRHVVRVHII